MRAQLVTDALMGLRLNLGSCTSLRVVNQWLCHPIQ